MALASTAFKLPAIYRLFFLTVEPISAVVGAVCAHFQPTIYLSLTHAASADGLTSGNPDGDIPLVTRIILTQLANLYLLFAINEALVLRCTGDLRVWRTLLLSLLLADLGHLYSGLPLGWPVYWRVSTWSAMDCGNIGFVYIGAMMRVCFLLGVGLPSSAAPRSKKT